jgi:hypothetical protein
MTNRPARRHAQLLLILVVLATAFALPAYAQEKALSKDQAAAKNPLLGRWKSDEATIEIRGDGSITINGENYKYKVIGRVIMVSNDEGSLPFPYELKGDTLLVDAQGRLVTYKRLKGDEADTKANAADTKVTEGIVPAFVGKWCYLSSLTGTNSFMSSRCFTLYQNGTYEFAAESSTSGAYGSTAGQSYDTGRWTATRTTLTAHSTKNGKIVYPIELRNHPKTGDPMIVVDGDAYVTAFKKSPW